MTVHVQYLLKRRVQGDLLSMRFPFTHPDCVALLRAVTNFYLDFGLAMATIFEFDIANYQRPLLFTYNN